MTTARYDGFADWYDQTFAGYGDLAAEGSSGSALTRLLGPGEGWCLDIGCGTGLHFGAVEATGRRVVGVDLSADQLRIAHRRADTITQADATRLPFADATFEVAVCAYVHTDTDRFADMITEIARVLRPGGRLVYLGVHPCFRGHFVEYAEERRVLHPGYWDTGWHHTSPYRPTTAIRERVGAHHLTVSALLNVVLDSGLRLTRVEESDPTQAHPDRILLTAIRS